MPRPVALFAALLVAGQALAHEEEGKSPGQVLGKVNFKTSCSKAVQPKFKRAVALLHSFWYTES